MGPSGSGKTTLLTLIGSLQSVQDGNLSILGQELLNASKEQMMLTRRHIGYIFQAHNLLNFLTVYQNVEMALEIQDVTKVAADARIRAVLTAVGLEHQMNYFIQTIYPVDQNSVSRSPVLWSVSLKLFWQMNAQLRWIKNWDDRL